VLQTSTCVHNWHCFVNIPVTRALLQIFVGLLR